MGLLGLCALKIEEADVCMMSSLYMDSAVLQFYLKQKFLNA